MGLGIGLRINCIFGYGGPWLCGPEPDQIRTSFSVVLYLGEVKIDSV